MTFCESIYFIYVGACQRRCIKKGEDMKISLPPGIVYKIDPAVVGAGRVLTLGELEFCPGAFLAVFFPFLGPWITGQQA